MTEVELLANFPISPDGLRVETWKKGDVRFVDDDTLRILVSEGVVAIVDRTATGAPSNKAHRRAPSAKRKGRGI